MYSTVRDIIKKIGGSPDEGKALIGGSASINKFGTIHRPSAVAHDLDIDSYIGGASKRPWEPIPGPDYVTDAWYDKFVGPLERPGAVEASPILQRIREQFPKTHANAPILEWDDAMWKDNVANRYKEGVFQKINNFPDVYPQFTGRQFIGTRINGVPVDIFLADTRINQVPGSVYAPPETAFEYKRMYAEENALNGRPPRPKDVADFESYRPFSRENPVVDPETGRAQFSPSNFGDQILTEENLPAVSNVETYPGSGEAVPMIMNTKGQMVYPFSDAVLRQDAKGGETNRWGGNLQSEGRPLYLFRDDKGKTTGYGTTESIIIPGVGEQAGQFVVAPTIVNGKKLTNEQAVAHYRESGEYWAARPTAEEADRTAQEVHEDHARIYGPQWNKYIEAHPDELSEKLKAEIEESKKAEVRQDAEGGMSRRDADVAREAEKIRSTKIRVEGDNGAVKGTVAEVADLAPAAQRGRIENAVEADAASRARRAEYDRLAAENRKLVGEAGLARYDELTAKGRPDARSQTSDALAYALRDNPVLAPESRPDAPVRPTHDKNGHPLTYTQDSKWTPDAAPRATRRESSADREFREATHVPTGVTMIGDQKFTTYADGTIGDTTAEHLREARESKALSEALLRQDAKGGDAGDEVTENAEIVNNGEVADTPVTNGPRIVINPTTFRNGKDALCVAFNERFRVFMEASGYEPQSEPTEDQRRFFADTAYADDELMLRRTILARIATLDTSVKDPTDAQISDTLQMLRQFKETERPDDTWQANALDRIIGLVQSVEPAERATPRPT